MIKNVYLETYGCAANQNNSEILSGLLARAGFNIVNNEKIADIAILNTCIVKGPTLQRMQFRIKELAKKFKKFIVAGCMPDVFLEQIKQLAPNASLLSSHEIKNVVNVTRNLLEDKHIQIKDSQAEHETKILCPKNRKNPIIGITQISEGCFGDCAYCITRFAKGKLFSYPEKEIIKNIEQDIAAGCKEVWLTSQDCAAYGLDKRTNLARLLKNILNLKHNFFLRLGMSNPNHILKILDELIGCYQNKKMFKFLHIPLQSGSNEILKKMNRRYTAGDFLKIIDKFKEKIPNITISTDIIVGFPGETEEDFQKTLEMIEKIKPAVLNISRFWPMPKTPASQMKTIPDQIVKKRSIKLREIFEKNAFEKNKEYIRKKIRAIVDEKSFNNTWIARSQEYKPIVIKLKEKILGKKVEIVIKNATSKYLIGEMINNKEN